VGARHLVRQPPHLAQRREVGEVHAGRADLARHRLGPLAVAPVDDHPRAAGGEVARHVAAEAVGRAGHQDEHAL
jgi:hypothetical protein